MPMLGLPSDCVDSNCLWLSLTSFWNDWGCLDGGAWWLSVELLRSNQISVGLLGISQNKVWSIYYWIPFAFEWMCEAFTGEFMVPVSACAVFTVELRVPVTDWLEYLRWSFMVHMNDFMKGTVVSYFVLPLRRILPCLRSLPQFCYLKIVWGEYFLFPFINRTPLTMPFAFCVQ
jgi:hypothetical protein